MTTKAPGKGRHQAPQVSPKRAAQLHWLEQSVARYRAKRRAHPRREMLLDLVVGVLGAGGFVVLALSYLSIIRW